ncbi:MAG: RNA polymerase sigma-70 factor [Tannerellaceae bacterium]|nr:RNA polymerase sigma-70 factor [Tannerellaceae bacterium]
MVYEEFYIHWYSRMKHFACEYVVSHEDAEDIVQEVLTELYEKYDLLKDHVNLVAYIFTAVKNRCIDHLRQKIRHQESATLMQEEYYLAIRMKFDSLEILDQEIFREDTIEQIIRKALEKLPEKCRRIFIQHKIEGRKQQEIAKELNLSPKTIENQITIAYKKLREELKHFPSLLTLLL